MPLYKLPKEMYAEIARFLGGDFPGNGFRLAAGAVQIRDYTASGTYLNGLLHSFNDEPAVIYADGSTRKWYHNGLLHRENMPAVIWFDGTHEWFTNDLLHREDGPAVMWANGIHEWYRHGKFISIASDYFY
jgi:hypothetical protein